MIQGWLSDANTQKEPEMLQSHLIDVDGVFVGAAIRLDRGYRVLAVDLRLYDIDSTIFPTLGEIERVARRLGRSRPSSTFTVDRDDPALQVGG